MSEVPLYTLVQRLLETKDTNRPRVLWQAFALENRTTLEAVIFK